MNVIDDHLGYCKNLCSSKSDHTHNENQKNLSLNQYAKENSIHSDYWEKEGEADANPDSEVLSQAQLKNIAKRTKKDETLYEFALMLFRQRVAYVEADVGFRFLNCHFG